MAIAVLIYAITIATAVWVGYMFLRNAELAACRIRRQIPLVPSARALRDAVIKEIRENFPKMKTAVDIGSGFGGLARRIARECDLRVEALENMPFAALVSRARDNKNCRTIWCDAFGRIAESDGYDIAVAYLGPGVNGRLAGLAKKFRVLITLAVPVPGLTPTRVVDIGHGATRYGRNLYPHKLFIYELGI
ncbi:MAG: hypothetical protein LBL46_03590 [Rickettsiales bacterium]|jgi:hypothetical protein|nr:hypothetical protein [Rickettsiales bacterium]